MVCSSLRHGDDELLGQRGGLPAYRAKGSAFGIPLLAPWANRLDAQELPGPDGPVALDPAEVKVDGQGLPKDGLLSSARWEVLDEQDDRLSAEHELTAEELRWFPYPHRLRIDVALEPDALTATTTLTATGDVPVPIAFGWHPLFALPGVPREQLHVTLPVREELLLDPRGIPTGATVPVGPPITPSDSSTTSDDVATPPDDAGAAARDAALPGDGASGWRDGPLGERTLDAEFVASGEPFVLAGGGRALEVRFGAPDYPIGHAWAPAGESFVAWEPMTAPTNALRSGDGLRHAAPGAPFTATFDVRLRGF